jgi:hypothetical protein
VILNHGRDAIVAKGFKTRSSFERTAEILATTIDPIDYASRHNIAQFSMMLNNKNVQAIDLDPWTQSELVQFAQS